MLLWSPSNSGSVFSIITSANTVGMSGYSYSSQTNAGPILNFIALGFSGIGMVIYSIAVAFTRHDVSAGVTAEVKAVAAAPAATAAAAPAVAPAAVAPKV